MIRLRRGLATLGIASALMGGALLSHPAQANQTPSIEELQVRVQQAAEAYDKAMANLDSLNSQAAENQEKINTVEAEIPLQKEKSKQAVRTLYKLSQGQGSMLDLVLSSADFNTFISIITYLNSLEQKHTNEANKLVSLQEELSATQEALSSQQNDVKAQEEAAYQALKEAEALRQQAVEQAAREAEAQARAEEEARKKAEEEARQKTEEEAKALAEAATNEHAAANANGGAQNQAPWEGSSGEQTTPAPSDTSSQNGSSTPAPSEPSTQEPQTPSQPNAPAPSTPSAPEPSGNSDRDAFVSEWTSRIDAYLAGSPLAGYGYAFAEAAYDSGVDPRWSPAISCVESGKGAACFRPHNAWGWGNVAWSDWDSAIRSHVAGLASGYGYTISPEAAQKYCPPTWQAWYDATSYQMSLI